MVHYAILGIYIENTALTSLQIDDKLDGITRGLLISLISLYPHTNWHGRSL